MDNYIEKIELNLFEIIKNIKNPSILEFGVQSGESTIRFLDLCNKNNGYLYSVDIDDCSKVSNDKRWKFIKTRDDNFDIVKSQIPKELDVIFIDSVHEANHVEKIFYNYYDQLKIGGYLFIDDISHLPYVKNGVRNNFYCEINNRQTFDRILEIYFSNYNNFDLNFSFQSSGLAIIKKKKSDALNKKIKIESREFSIKNLIKKLLQKFKG